VQWISKKSEPKFQAVFVFTFPLSRPAPTQGGLKVSGAGKMTENRWARNARFQSSMVKKMFP
jgi:hypothetical protein